MYVHAIFLWNSNRYRLGSDLPLPSASTENKIRKVILDDNQLKLVEEKNGGNVSRKARDPADEAFLARKLKFTEVYGLHDHEDKDPKFTFTTTELAQLIEEAKLEGYVPS